MYIKLALELLYKFVIFYNQLGGQNKITILIMGHIHLVSFLAFFNFSNIICYMTTSRT